MGPGSRTDEETVDDPDGRDVRHDGGRLVVPRVRSARAPFGCCQKERIGIYWGLRMGSGEEHTAFAEDGRRHRRAPARRSPIGRSIECRKAPILQLVCVLRAPVCRPLPTKRACALSGQCRRRRTSGPPGDDARPRKRATSPHPLLPTRPDQGIC